MHDHKLGVIASTIIGLDSHTKDYPAKVIRELKRAKADFTRVFYATAWPGTPFFESLEKEGRANRNWDEVRKDVPSIAFKHFTREEVIAARKQILDAFFNVFSITRVVSRWFFRERALILMYIKVSIRNRIAEFVKRRRRYTRL